MSAEANDSSSREQRVNEVIAAYLAAVDAGETPNPNDFIAQHRDIADDLQAFFADGDMFERIAQPFRGVTHLPNRQQDAPAAAGKSPPLDGGSPTDMPSVAAGVNVRRFGDYELLEELARGGMGVVYKARQTSLNRIVALKMILAGQLASADDVRRFHAESEAAANLDHPGIVPIYDVGTHEGQHYFSMGYVNGCSLDEQLRDGPLPAREAAALLNQICDAVQYAHEHDVIHRDLKPANILLEQSQPSSVESASRAGSDMEWSSGSPQLPGARSGTLDSRPRITDFGLAKRLSGGANLTQTGQVLGTPSYMSPEQATAGAKHPIGIASDVYSLGTILYKMLTGRPPFQAETPIETLSQLLESDPLPPRLLNPNVPRELEAICMQCLAKEPEQRYPSARHLRDELQRYLDGETVRASGINLLDRVTRALRPSMHEERFQEWGLGLIAFGVVIFLSHVAIYSLEGVWRDPLIAYFLPRSLMFAVLLLMLWQFRRYSLLPTNSAERLIWVVWIGYLLALGASNVARSVFGHDQRESYASFAVLAGFGFLIMGGHVWGGGYVVGLLFLIAAPVLAAYVDVAPLASGALWGGALLAFGLHYWQRGRAAQAGDSAGTDGA